MRRRRRNHQKQPIIDQLRAALEAAPASRRRATPGAPRVIVALVPTSRLRAALGPRMVAPGAPCVTTAPVPTSWLRAAPRSACVPWAPAPASRCRAALGAPRVPEALGRIKIVEPSSSENRAPGDFFQHPPPGTGQLQGLRVSLRLQAE
jgi:hypothetical protein